MGQLFLSLFNLGASASWVVLAVLLLRILFKKAPKRVLCILWALVAVRLLIPELPQAVFSLLPSAEPLPQEILLSPAPTVNSGISALDEAINPFFSQSLAPNPGDSVNPLQVYAAVAGCLWLFGMIGMLIYMAVSYCRVLHSVREAIPSEKGMMLCDRLSTPFVMGILRPRIYLPSDLSEADTVYVLAHERAHLKRLDHVWKPLGFLLLSVYWFHPLLWVAYLLFCRDIELACDETVLARLGKNEKKPYSEALIRCSMPRGRLSGCPLAFGELGVKERVKNAMRYKKTPVWLIILLSVVIFIASFCLLTNPKIVPREPSYPIPYPHSTALSGVDEDGHHWMLATVLEDQGGFLLVRPHSGELPESISVSKKLTSKRFFPEDIAVGDTVKILHNGQMTLSYPPTLHNVYDILEMSPVATQIYTRSVVYGKVPDKFNITLYSNGTFSFYETMLSSYMGHGTYRIEDGILIITTNDGKFVNRFRVENDCLIFLAEGSTNFPYIKLTDGDRFQIVYLYG